MPTDTEKFAKEFQAFKPEYNGWTFEYMYPGNFAYSKGDVVLFFTPDWNLDGVVDPQVTSADGDPLHSLETRPEFQPLVYAPPLTVEVLFTYVQRMLDYMDSVE